MMLYYMVKPIHQFQYYVCCNYYTATMLTATDKYCVDHASAYLTLARQTDSQYGHCTMFFLTVYKSQVQDSYIT